MGQINVFLCLCLISVYKQFRVKHSVYHPDLNETALPASFCDLNFLKHCDANSHLYNSHEGGDHRYLTFSFICKAATHLQALNKWVDGCIFKLYLLCYIEVLCCTLLTVIHWVLQEWSKWRIMGSCFLATGGPEYQQKHLLSAGPRMWCWVLQITQAPLSSCRLGWE